MNDNNRNNLLVFAVILSLGFIIGALIIGGTWKKVSRGNVTITVTGSAQKEIRSDLATWDATFSAESQNMQDAYAKLQVNNKKVKKVHDHVVDYLAEE